ncbi:MAG: hypothetical protein LBE37_06610 [Sphingobacterium sp.]|jgi:hypothetical protein|nr:hypothetical protein [Sphingobacterium sp.]
MITVLTNLKNTVELHNIPHLNQEEDEQIKQNLLLGLAEIENSCHSKYLSHDKKMAQKSFQLFYGQLVSLFDQLYQFKNQHIDEIILKYHQLLTRFEELYHQDMDLQAPLSKYQIQVLGNEISKSFPTLEKALLRKGIGQNLLLEIQSAINGHFGSKSVPLRYHHLLFYNKMLSELTKMAIDTRDKDWERRFIETIININFNHLGFFNRCTELINLRLGELSEENKILCIDENQLRISQASRDSRLYFDPTRARLADLLIQYAEQRKSVIPKPLALTEAKTTDAPETNPEEVFLKPIGIPTQLNAYHINLLTHYLYLAEVYPEDMSKREICSYISEHILTKRGKFVSKESLEKFDRAKLESGAGYVHGLLTKMILALERDFDHLFDKKRD